MPTKSFPGKPAASKRGAPLGNKNAAGNAGNWYPRGNFITRHLISTLLANSDYCEPQRAKLVRKLAERLARRPLKGIAVKVTLKPFPSS
jgi:uncharacterized protein YjcR